MNQPFPQLPESQETQWASACPLCGTEYTPEESHIIEEKEGAFFLHTECPNCGSSVVATLVANHLGVSSIGLITDMTEEDAQKFKDSKTISDDDVLDTYQALEALTKNIDLRQMLKLGRAAA